MHKLRNAALLCALALSAAPLLSAQGGAPAPIAPGTTLNPATLRPAERVTLPESGVTVPLRMAPRPTVEVRVNGQGPFRFLLETVGGPSELSAATAGRLGLRPAAPGSELPSVRVDSLRVGGALLEGITAVVPREMAPGVDGILGLSTLSGVLLTLDFAGSELRLARGSLGPPNGRDLLPLVPAGRFWGVGEVRGVEVELAGRRGVAVLNAQSPGGISAVPARAASLPLASAPVVVGRMRNPVLGDAELRAARLGGDARVGAYTWQRPILTVAPAPEQLPQAFALGMGALRGFAVTWDQRGGVLRLARADTAPVPPTPPIRTFGFSTGRATGGMEVVTEVRAGSEAERAGVRPGDEITVVDGRPALTVDPAAWRALVETPGPVQFRFRREGADRDVWLVPTILVA